MSLNELGNALILMGCFGILLGITYCIGVITEKRKEELRLKLKRIKRGDDDD